MSFKRPQTASVFGSKTGCSLALSAYDFGDVFEDCDVFEDRYEVLILPRPASALTVLTASICIRS